MMNPQELDVRPQWLGDTRSQPAQLVEAPYLRRGHGAVAHADSLPRSAMVMRARWPGAKSAAAVATGLPAASSTWAV